MLKTILIAICFAGVHGWAQGQSFVNFNTENSKMPSNQVNCVAVDADNNKWIGTDNGFALLQADGKFVINKTDTLLQQISAIVIDKEGNKWVGSYYKNNVSLVKLDKTGKYVSHIAISTFKNKNFYINGIAIDKKGNKWIATEQGGVLVINQKGERLSYDQSTVGEEFPSNSVKCIAVDKDDMKWVGTTGGLVSTEDGSEWILYDLLDKVNAMAVDDKGNVCVGMVDEKKKQTLYCNNELYKLARKDGRDGYQIADIVLDPTGNVWTAGTGIGKYEKGVGRTIYDLENKDFGSNAATSIDIDKTLDLWVGSSDKGLFKFEPPKPKVAPETRPEPMLMASLKALKEKPTIETKSLNKPSINVLPIKSDIIIPTLPEEKIEEKPKEVLIENKRIKIGEVVRLDKILFQKASHYLENTKGVEILLLFMKENPHVEIELAGHTDKNPAPTHRDYDRISAQHLELSQKRVEEVAKYLIDRGVETSRIITKAYGGDKPAVDKSSEFNRRVELKLLKID